MNVRDSEVIAGLLTTNHYALTTNADEADVILFNTCSVRQHAEDKVWSEVGKHKRTTDHKSQTTMRQPIIGIIGCMAQNYKDKIFERAPGVDIVCGTNDINKLPGIIGRLIESRVSRAERKIISTDSKFRAEDVYKTDFHQDKRHTFVVISEGCDNFCSYCVVPYVRGRLRNRRVKDIVDEIKRHIDSGISKITLLGQNVNAYTSLNSRTSSFKPRAKINFVELLKMVSDINGMKELSFITSHPKDIDKNLFHLMQEKNNIRKYLHLPFQSGSDRILRLMNRGYTRNDYLGIVNAYRSIVSDGILTTDVIVGFPSETEKDFKDTYNLIKSVEFDAAYIFKYSPRPHTKALKFNDDVPLNWKKRRHWEILKLQKKISNAKKNKIN